MPRQPEAVFQPAAGAFLAAAGDQLVPVFVHFFLAVAVDGERDRFGELELRSAVEREEVLAVELEVDDERAALRSGLGAGVGRGAVDLGVLEDRGIEVHGFFGVAVEPQGRGDALFGHFALLGESVKQKHTRGAGGWLGVRIKRASRC